MFRRLRLRSGFALPSLQTAEHFLILIDGDSHLDRRAASLQTLNRYLDPSDKPFWQGYLGVNSLSALRQAEAHTAEAVTEIGSFYRDVLNRSADPDPGVITNWENALGTSSAAAVRMSFAVSAEAASDIAGLYVGEFGRQADPGAIPYWQTALAGPWHLTGIRWYFAHLPDAAAAISSVYQQVLGRAADSSASYFQDQLQNPDYNLSNVAFDLASSAEAASKVTSLLNSYQVGSPFAIQFSEAELASGVSLSQIGSDLLQLAAYNPPDQTILPPGIPVGPYRDLAPNPGAIPIGARDILSYRTFIYDQGTDTYQVQFHFRNDMKPTPTYNDRGSSPRTEEFGFVIVTPGTPTPTDGKNPLFGIRIGFKSYYPGLLYGKPYFIVYANGQAISPVTGRTVSDEESHYPIDVRSTARSILQSY